MGKLNTKKFVRKVVKATDFSFSPSKSSNAFGVYVEQMQQGIAVAYVTKKRNQTDSAAYIYPILKKLEDESTAKELDIDFVSIRRKNEKSNDRLPSEPNGTYGFPQFVRVFHDETDNTVDNCKDWGEKLADAFSNIAKDTYTYPKKFEFVKNLTKSVRGKLPKADKNLQNDDIIKVMDMMYSPTLYNRDEQAENLAELFFSHDIEKAKQFVRSLDDV